MSWNVNIIGSPEAVCEELRRVAGTMYGQGKLEFDAAFPHLEELVTENFNAREGRPAPLVHLTASGSGGVADGKQLYRYCRVSIEPVYAKLV